MKIFSFFALVCSLNLMGCYLNADLDMPAISSTKSVSQVIPGETVEITYIANEGVFISAGDKQVLIDALHKPYRPAYLSTPPETEALIMASAAPFDDVDFLLVSHIHKDHFDAATVADYMKRQTEVSLFTSGQVIASVTDDIKPLEFEAEKEAGRARAKNMVAVRYEDGEHSEMEKNGIHVTAGKVAHGSERFSHIQNLGYVIQMEERSMLHVGDPGFGRADIAQLLSSTGTIDIALLPSWFVTEEEGREVIDHVIQPTHLIIVHVSPDGVDSVQRAVDRYYPDATVFSKPMQSVRY